MMIAFFFFLAAVCLGAVVAMIVSKNQAYNALFLVLAFAAIGGLFGLLGAPFMAVVQIIIYSGAIMVVFIFVLMMINLRQGISPERRKWTIALAVLIAAVLCGEIILAAKGFLSASPSPEAAAAGPTDIGRLLFTKYLYPFEITSVLIVASLVGAIVLAKKREKE
jgi:NADH-quinone oxidoreductase subunit J